MVDELRTLREAESEADLRRAYALWMAEHTGAFVWELRQARTVFRDRRKRLHERAALPTAPAAVSESLTTWLADWAAEGVSQEELQSRVPELVRLGEEHFDETRFETLLDARGQWLLLKRKPGISVAHLEILEQRLRAPAAAAGIKWEAGPTSRALARRVRDEFPLVHRCDKRFFRPHLAPPALQSDLEEAKQRKRLTSPGFKITWSVVLTFVALNALARNALRCSEETKPRPPVTMPDLDRFQPGLPRFRTEAQRREQYETLEIAARTDTTAQDLIDHLERFGRKEDELRAALDGNGPDILLGDEILRTYYKVLLARLDSLREDR